MIQAEERRTAGAYAESAAIFGQAYHARSEAERADSIGEIAIRSAITDYELASASTPSDRSLLEAQARLLGEFLAAREVVRAEAMAKNAKRIPNMPLDLIDELERLNTRISELRQDERRAAGAEDASEPEPDPDLEPDPAPKPPSEPAPKPEPSTPVTQEPEPSLKRDAAIVGVGVAAFAGGGGLIASGVWNFVQSNERADAQRNALAAGPQYTNEQRQTYLEGLHDWQQEWRTTSVAFLAAGAVLAAAGIGLTTWGSVRLHRHRSASGSRVVLGPTMARQRVGAFLAIRF